MTADQFDSASPQERNEAIAIGLGWKKLPTACGYRWSNPRAHPLANTVTELPDWQGKDGLAFEELWPEILKVAKYASMYLRSSTKRAIVYSPEEFEPRFWEGDTWAHAIAKCFLSLKGAASGR